MFHRIAAACAAILILGCDAAEISKTCSAEIVGAEINPSDLYPADGMPDHRRWVAAKLIGTCSTTDVAAIRVQLFGTNPDVKFLGFGASDSVDGDCATWVWPASPDLDDFIVALDAAKVNAKVSAISSFGLPDWLSGSKLPAWKVDGEWSLYLPHPKHQQGCYPVE